MVIFDTNILIELYRGNTAVKEDAQRITSNSFYVSSITVAEFMVGAKNKDDFKRIEKDLSKYIRLPTSTLYVE
jgi:tRNA(fMet)-specific endonuclease VapC